MRATAIGIIMIVSAGESALSCRRYRPGSAAGSVTLSGYYPAGVLSVEAVTDGDGRRTLTFTDFRGRLILTRSLLNTTAALTSVPAGEWTDTYNVYDDAGNLLCVVTPIAAPKMATKGSTWSETSTSPLTQCFRYTYDGAMRLRSKKAPDAAEVKYWYDATGALVLTQDGVQRSRGVCSFAIADSLGRAALSGECTYSQQFATYVEGRHVVATRSAATDNINGYAVNVTLASPEVISSSYYDDYSFLSLSCFNRLSQKLTAHPLPTHKAQPKGLQTGSWSAVLSPGESFLALNDSTAIARNGYLSSTVSAFCYDTRDRLVATATADHLGGLCLESSTLNNAGMPVTTQLTRWPLLTSESTDGYQYSYTYDALGRVSNVTFNRGGKITRIQSNTYDAIGQLTRAYNGLTSYVSYTYTPSGSISSITATGNGATTFAQRLNYTTGPTPSYSGNIGSIDWHGADNIGRRYAYTYDALGRLKSAAYSEPSGRSTSNPVKGTVSYSTSYTYDADSRPLTVKRFGVNAYAPVGSALSIGFGQIDNLTLTYTGSRLTKVADAAADVIYAGASDFNDGADSATEYTYDVDGRLISDANKGITSIKYNVLGVPAVISFSDGSSITNLYSGDGALLQRVKEVPFKLMTMADLPDVSVVTRTNKTVDDHIGAMTFRKGALWRIDIPNGFIESGNFHYYIKDYQGNIRQVTDANGKVEQDNHYYPYGMLMGESSDIMAAARGNSSANSNPYLFGSKEYLTTAGANLLDFTARTYDPSIPLFHTQDPMAGDYTPFLPYLYCGGDPINRIDPDGREWEIEEIRDKNGLKVNIRVTGVLLNLSSKRFDMEALNNSIKEQLETVYSCQLDGISVNLTADIRLVESVNDIVVSDHIFMVVDNSCLGKSTYLALTNGYTIQIGTELAAQTISGENQRSIAHELGHSGGLRDVTSERNTLKINDSSLNLMTQIKDLPKEFNKNACRQLEPIQIKQLINNYKMKNQIKDMNPYTDLSKRVEILQKALRKKKLIKR